MDIQPVLDTLFQALEEFRARRRHLDAQIDSLTAAKRALEPVEGKKSRTWSEARRTAHGDRMRKYWAERRLRRERASLMMRLYDRDDGLIS